MSQIKNTPQSNYSGPITVDPLTRIEGHLRIEVEVENGKVKDARSCSTLFRGLELILKGRDPRDAQHFTQRTCGVCTYTHAIASTRALEDAIKVEIPKNATLIRNLVMGTQFMHDHLVHFYHLHALDFVDVVSALSADPAKAAKINAEISSNPTSEADLRAVQATLKKFVDGGQLGPFTNAYFLGGHPAFYLDPEANLIATAHYLAALRMQVDIAKAQAIFGAKNPHTQFTVAGGVTCYNALKKESLDAYEELYKKGREFIEQVYIPDLLLVAGAYKDWAGIGGGASNYMSFGEFPAPGGERDLDSRWIKPGIIMNRDLGKVEKFDPAKIEEHVRHSWYAGAEAKHPYEGVTAPKFTKIGDQDRYSWMKAPRYNGQVMETGPLATCLISYAQGHETIKPTVDHVLGALGVGPEALFSTLGRTAARGIEALCIARQVENWLAELRENVASGDTKIVENCEVPKSARGVGYVNAPRGGLSHWLDIADKKIANFQLVVPSTWNLGPRDLEGQLSAVEQALVGSPVADPKRPVEILRIVHSFDPCIACGVHVIDGRTNEVHEFKVL